MPVILLTDRDSAALPEAARTEAALVLVKPVDAKSLLERVRVTIERSRELRARGAAAMKRVEELRQKTERIRAARSQAASAAVAAAEGRLVATTRACPKCGTTLEWIERGTLGGSAYDYYHWCVSGCGLFCYDVTTHRRLKLAG